MLVIVIAFPAALKIAKTFAGIIVVLLVLSQIKIRNNCHYEFTPNEKVLQQWLILGFL